MKSKYWIIIIIGLAILTAIFLLISNKRITQTGTETAPSNERLVSEAKALYEKAKENGVDFSNGPCLGEAEPGWVVDVAHNPRQLVDNLSENQCQDYISGKDTHFIELDPNGNLIIMR